MHLLSWLRLCSSSWKNFSSVKLSTLRSLCWTFILTVLLKLLKARRRRGRIFFSCTRPRTHYSFMDLSLVVLIGAGTFLTLLIPVIVYILIHERRKLTTLRPAGAVLVGPNYGSLLLL